MKALAAICLLSFVILSQNTSPARGAESTNCVNVFISSPALPQTLKRVLILPLACEESRPDLSGGCQILDSVLQQELVKTGKFEVVIATPEILRSCTGSLSWTGAEILPQAFFESLRNVYGCDAVMFCELTTFQSSAPLAIGWRLKLADATTGKILWAADSLFDEKNPAVSKSAQQFEKGQQPHHNFAYNVYSFFAWCVNTPTRSALDDQWNIMHSPRYFGEFTAKEVLKTLPAR